MNRLPHLPDVVLAVAVAEMRQDIDRCVGEKIDVVAAERQGALDIAGIERVEQLDHASAVKFFHHRFASAACLVMTL